VGSRRAKTILVVEDDEGVRQLALLALRHHGFHTLEAFDGHIGLSAFMRHREDIDLVLTDIVMPHSGAEMVDQILRFTPSANIVFMSGTAGAPDLPSHLRHFPVLRKPFTTDALIRAVGGALSRRE
jgi:two-component system cell cycle sensor histidine kinase/response regulator CckA